MTPEGPTDVLDRLLPEWDVAERHQLLVHASPEDTYDSLRSVDMGRSAAIRTLFKLRGLPRSALTFDGLARLRFLVLEEDRPRRFTMGIIGRFWTLRGDLQRFEPTEFAEREYPGLAKAVWGFQVASTSDDEALLTTETRVLCPDPPSRRRFRRYWRVVRPFSGWIRKEVLRIVKIEAEARSEAGA